jgi:arylsulfatase A-like enzyme
MKRRDFLKTAGLVMGGRWLTSFEQVTCAVPKQPNIILVLSDDQGYGDIGRHGHPVLKTPNIDRLHDESVRLTDFSVSPTCSPTRAALMTGMQEFNSGVTHTLLPRRLMNPVVMTLPQVLGEAGYATAMFGKWHLGQAERYLPSQRGFGTALTVPGDNQRSHYDPKLLLNGKPHSMRGYRTDIFFNEAMKWISAQKEQPFFCYIPTYNAHAPHIFPEKYGAPYKRQVAKTAADFFGMLANLDMNIGRLLDHLDAEKLTEKTLVIFMNDNGGTKGVDVYNGGMRGCKATIWRGGTRAFCFWRWPKRLKPRDEIALSAHIDVLPTLAELAGAKISKPVQDSLEGFSLAKRLVDPNAPWPDRMLFQHVSRWGNGLADKHRHVNCGIRWRKWHLLRSTTCELECDGECKHFRRAAEGGEMGYTERPHYHYAQTPKGRWALYDLANDLGQDRNVAEAHPVVVERMVQAYEAWWDKVRPLMINEEKRPRETSSDASY